MTNSWTRTGGTLELLRVFLAQDLTAHPEAAAIVDLEIGRRIEHLQHMAKEDAEGRLVYVEG